MLKYLDYFQTSLLLAAIGWLMLRALFLRVSRAAGAGDETNDPNPFGSTGGDEGAASRTAVAHPYKKPAATAEDRC